MKQLSLPRFQNGRVLILGDVMLDRYWHGGTHRISPEAPVPVVKVEQIEDRPGGAANVALNVSALGTAAVVAGFTGNDDAGHSLAALLNSAGILTAFEVTPNAPTITKLRVISRHQQLIRLDFEEPILKSDPIGNQSYQGLMQQTLAELDKASVLILSDYKKGVVNHPEEIIQAARKKQIPVLVDPKGTDFERYRGATLLTPNLSEFEAVVGHCASEKELVERGLSLLEKLDLEALLVTRSEQGMTLLRRGLPELHLPATAREVFDVTGAGDTVISVLAASLAAGAPLDESVALANIAAGIVVGKLGTAAISAPELRRAVQNDHGMGTGVMSEEQLLIAIEDARAQGERIVMTNGCFDIIHAGHVGYLEQAKAKGDRLIVAVNSDDSVRRLKGPSRPINPQDRRMTVLAGLEAVDWVTVFTEDTPERLIKRFKPDVLVKGGDYKLEEIVGWDTVQAYGGEVSVLSFLDDCSTTAIVNKIEGRTKSKD